jgi:autotransporter-associated beta strand protein
MIPRRSLTSRRTLITATLSASLLLASQSIQAANTELDVVNGQSDLTLATTFGAGTTTPTAASDVTFTAVTYSPAAFTISGATAVNFGTLNDLSATALTLSNGTASTTATLNLGGGTGDSVSGSASGDLLYVASGGTLTIQNGTGTLNLALASSGNFDVVGTATISSVISGTGFGITKTGAGTLTLSGTNTYTGGTTISAGTVSISANLNLGATGSAISLNGGTLKETNAAAITNTQIITIGSSGGTINVSGKQYVFNTQNTLLGTGALTIVGGAGTLADGSSFLGNVALNVANTYSGAITLQSGGSLEFNNNAAISSAAPITINSNGELIVDTNINVANALTVNGGELTFNNGNNGVFSGAITLNGTGATVRLADFYQTTARSGTITGNISGTGGLTMSNFASTLTLTGANTYTGNTVIGTGVTLVNVAPTARTYSGVISGAGAFTKSGPGALTLTGTNTYTGTTTVANGTLNVGDGTSGALASTALTFNGAGGTVNFNEAAGSSQSMGALTFSAGENKVQSTYGGSGTSTVTFSNVVARTAGATANFVSSSGTNGSSNKIVFTQVAGATPSTGTLLDKGYFFNGSNYAAYDTGGFVRAFGLGDTGYVTATGSNTIASTSTNNVVLTGNVDTQASAGINTLNLGANTLALASGAAFTTNGILVSGNNASSISGGTSLSSTTASSDLVIRTDLSTDNLTISTPIINNTSTALTKSGAGTLTLTGANTYTGATTIDAGKLSLTGTATLAATAITVNAGSTLEFAGTTNSFAGQLTVNGGNVNILSGTVTDGLNANNNVLIGGANTQANMSISSGATFTNNATTAFIKIGASTNSLGIVNNAGTMTATINGGNLGAAQGAIGVLYNTGTFSQTGSVNLGHGIYMANAANSYGYIYNTGTINITSLLGLQRSDGTTNITPGSAVMDVAGGTVNIATQTSGDGQGLKINSDATSYASLGTAQLNITGGTLNVGTTSAGTVTVNNSQNTYSSVNVSGSSALFDLKTTSGINLNGSSNANNVSTLSLANGGTLRTSFVDNSGSALSTGVLSLNNATIKATAADATALIRSGVSTFVESGGGTIDNGGFNVTVASALKTPTGNGLTNITLGGTTNGFVGAPVVVISGGGGTGAAAIANFDPNSGTITGFTITSPGSGYTSAPTITLYGGNGVIGSGASIVSGTTATATIAAVTSGGMTFAGSGTTTLSGANTYTGATTVNAGTLAIGSAGSLASTTYTIANGAIFNASAKTSYDLTGIATTIGVGASTAGRFTGPSGALTFGGTLALNFSTSALTDGQTYTLFSFGSETGNFTSVGATGSITDTFNRSGNIWTNGDQSSWVLSLDQSTGVLTVSAIPEPATYAAIFGVLALAGAGWRRRRSAAV